MRQIRQIHRLHTQGVSRVQISKRLFISRNTVKKYIELFNKEEIDQKALKKLLDSDLGTFLSSNEAEVPVKLQELQALFPYFEKELKKVGVGKLLLWKEYKEKYPDGYQSSQFCHYYAQWKQSSSVVMHFEHKAGDKLFIDYTGKKLSFIDKETGEVQECEVFVAVLGSSQYTYVEASRSQQKEDFIRSIENSLHYFKGVPQVLVTDNLKSAVIKSSKYEPTLNDTFLDFARYYQTSIMPTRAYKPRDKALVENSVRIAYSRIFAPLRKEVFFSLSELNKAVWAKLETHNRTNFQGRKYSRQDLFLEVEQKELYILPDNRYEMKQYAFGTVYKNSHVYLGKDKHYYSVPYQFIGKQTKLIFSDSKVDIYYKQEPIASHKRNYQFYRYSTQKNHMPSTHQFVSEWNPDKFIDWAEGIGEECRKYIIRVLQKQQHPEQNHKSCLGILSFAKKVGKERLNSACKRGLAYDVFSYRKITRLTKIARFRYLASTEEILFEAERNLDKNQLDRFSSGDFIKNNESILLTGSTGVGKSYIASALGHQASNLGYKVLYFNINKLFTKLKMLKADGSYLKEITRIERQDLIILDDFGLKPLDSQSRQFLMEIIEDRHGKRSTIISSNEWHEIIGEDTIADAILDRVVHSSHRIVLKGESMRKKKTKISTEIN